MDLHIEQILNQFLLKSLHIILDSRVPSDRPSNRSGSVKKSDKWFNLVLGDRPVGMESLSIWNRSSMEPMIVDIIIVQGSRGLSPDSRGSRTGTGTETVIERWTVQYECQRSNLQYGDVSYKKTYKKAIVLLRSVFSMLRLLPAYKAFRKLNSLKQICDFDISYKVCSFSSPFSRKEEEAMKKYTFFPVNAHQGHLSVSVVYRENLSDFKLDSFVSFPPEIITDYVGSPLADPMRAFPCTPSTRACPTSVPIRGRQHSSSRQRPHSWSSGLHRDVSLQREQAFGGYPPLFNSPYEYSPSSTEVYPYRNQHERSPGHHKRESDDFLSPPFSPSPSPSPPTHFSGGNPSQSRLNSETAPMSIPHSMLARSPRYLSPNSPDPNRHSLPPLSPRHTKFYSSSNESPSGIKTIRRLDSLRAGESSSGSMHASQKVNHDARDDSGRFSSLPSFSSSPHAAFSQSSSRVSFQDDMGDCDFSCPFIVDDVDPPDSLACFGSFGGNNPEVSSRTSLTTKKSQDAAVGALVHMLQTAPPLCHDSSYHTPHSSIIQHDGDSIGGSASEFFKPRKTSDALEELKAYKEMKDMLLSKSAAAHFPGKEKSKS